MKCGARMVELEEQDKLSDQVIEEATAELQSLQEEQEEMAAEAEEQRAQDQGNATKACVTEPLLRRSGDVSLLPVIAASLLRCCCVVSDGPLLTCTVAQPGKDSGDAKGGGGGHGGQGLRLCSRHVRQGLDGSHIPGEQSDRRAGAA